MLIKVSDKPFKLLKHLQASRRVTIASEEILNVRSTKRVRLKAKDKGKYLFRDLEICTQFSQLTEFLNDLCHRLKCCNKMISISKPVNTSAEQLTNKMCAETRCCLYCTINYFSSATATIPDQNQSTKSLSKLSTAQNGNNSTRDG